MSNDLTLKQTTASGLLLPAKFTQVLALRAKVHAGATEPRGTMHGQELRLTLGLSPSDAASAAFLLDFAGQGLRVTGRAHGPSAALLTWAFHALAASLKCTLCDADLGRDIEASPAAHREAAVAYLADYEVEVEATRRKQGDDDGRAFLAWLVREEHIALATGGGALGAELPMQDAGALYEMLLESDEVDDVFVSERELTSLLARYNARTTATG